MILLHTRLTEVMKTGTGRGSQEKTIIREEEEGMDSCSQAKEGLEQANEPHTGLPG